MIPFRTFLCCCLLVGAAARAEDFQGSTHALEFEEPPVSYSGTEPRDPAALLNRRLEAGEVTLAWDETFGYLPALLDALKVPRSSQTLVFSKTSLQRRFISPKNPRALYFNDDVYIGYVVGAPVLEVSGVDPKLGGIFYRLEQDKAQPPRLIRTGECLQCHAGPRSLGVPGHIMRSVPTDAGGELNSMGEVEHIDHTTPLADRWAGWYVTGKHGTQTHRGNLIGTGDFARELVEPNYRGNLAALSEFFDRGKTLGPGSDIVALMVLGHQVHMHNYITRLHFEAQQMIAMYGHIRYLKPQTDAFLRHLLFAEEAPLSAAVEGDPAFVRDFAAPARRDKKGRSLRDLDLHTRLFKYPCSFLIESPAFAALPGPMRESILLRLHKILTGADPDPQFAKLGAGDRQAILEILRETMPGLPDYWKGAAFAEAPQP